MSSQIVAHIRNLVLAGVVVGTAGCASVSVNKVTPETGKIVDGAAEGLRFYLPRPYVSVFEPFIVASEVFLANGELSADSTYVLLTQVPKGMDNLVGKRLLDGGTQSMGPLAIDARQVIARPAMPFGPQAAPVTDKASSESGKEENQSDAASGGKTVENASLGGVLNFKAINDNTAFAVTPQPRYFNILWLPDFDEQYVISAKPGLGNAGVVVTTGQGWNLQGLDAKVDNSAVVGPLLKFYSGTFTALQKLATAKIEAPLALLAGGSGTGPQSARVAGTKDAKAEFPAGTPVTVKVTKVRVVAPGLYPILKPKELQLASASSIGEQQKQRISDEEQKKRILVPQSPFTNIAFNTYDVIVIEAARSTGDSALRIQQYVDSTASGAGAVSVSPGTVSPKNANPLKRPTDGLNAVLSKPDKTTTKGDFYLATLSGAGDTIKVELITRHDGSSGTLSALPVEGEVKKLVIETLASFGVIVKTEDILIQ